MMKAAGYQTAIIGKWQLFSYDPPEMPEWRSQGTRPEDAGFDEYVLWHTGHTEDKGSRYADPTLLDNGLLRRDIPDAYGPDVLADSVDDFIRRNRQQPFFLYYPMVLTHDPFVPTPDSQDWNPPAKRHVDAKIVHPDTIMAMGKPGGRTKYFADMVSYLDKVMGRLVRTLEQQGLRERTLILFTSDNGTHQAVSSVLRGRSMKGGKGLTTDNGIHVPLIANWPGTIAAGGVSDDIVDSTDFLPTILDVAGGAVPPGIDGRSFAPQLRGQAGQPRDWAFFSYNPRPGFDKDKFTPTRFALDKKFKLYEDGRLFVMDADVDEKNPVQVQHASAEVGQSREKLQKVLDQLR